MNLKNEKVQSVIESSFSAVLDKIKREGDAMPVSDLFVQVDQESGELAIYEEGETLLEKIVIFNWVGNTLEESVFRANIVTILKPILVSLSSKDAFEHINIVKPFSVSYTDEEFAVIEELLFLDNDLFRLDDPLLKDLDTELDEFITNLLSDFE
jgi:hypothetical protein